jgi:hypothetical protein
MPPPARLKSDAVDLLLEERGAAVAGAAAARAMGFLVIGS